MTLTETSPPSYFEGLLNLLVQEGWLLKLTESEDSRLKCRNSIKIHGLRSGSRWHLCQECIMGRYYRSKWGGSELVKKFWIPFRVYICYLDNLIPFTLQLKINPAKYGTIP